MKYEQLHKELLKWKKENIITQEQFDTLENRYKCKEEPVERLHHKLSGLKIMIFTGITVAILGTLSMVAQSVPGLKEYLNSIVALLSLVLFIVGALYFGDYLADKKVRVLRYTGKVIMLLASLLTAFFVLYADIRINKVFKIRLLGGDWTLVLLVSGAILTWVAYKFREKVVLAYSLASFLIWIVGETIYRTQSSTGAWLGISLPAKLVIFALLVLGVGYLHKNRRDELKNFNPSDKYKMFYKTYYIFGLLVGFIPAWMASMGNWLNVTGQSLKIQSLIFVLLVMTVSLYCVYVGLVRHSKTFLNFGMTFFVLEVYGKFYEVFYRRIGVIPYYLLTILIVIGLAVMVEYVLTHKEELREELLAGKK